MGVLAKPIPFGKYFLLEKLNTGGMAEVYKAKTFGVEGFERIEAVKKILPQIAEDKEFISMFIDEAKIAGQLTHANIAQIYDLGNINDDYYIALEYVAGHDLRVIYDRCVRLNRKLDIGCVCYIISKICEGLDYAHNKKDANGEPMNIIHRDISPQNILISYEGDCKLIDFGIAKATNKSSATQVGILKGKFSYMSPEQVSGKANIDRRSDVFALGIVLFEMLTLKRLFLGSSDFETLEKIRKVEVSPPTLYNSDIPEELEDIVLKALEKDVTVRYQTANELQEALQRFMFKQNIYYTAKDLSEFMGSMFAQEIALEQKKMEFYKELTRDVLDQSRQPSKSPDDETSFYDKQNVAKMSGVQYEATTQPAPKQAIYAELDDFEPPRDNIVYSQKNPAIHNDNNSNNNNNNNVAVNDIVSASVNNNKPHAVPRKSVTMSPVLVKGRETLMTAPVPSNIKKNSSRPIFIAIVSILSVIILLLIGGWAIVKYGKKTDGTLTFNVYPSTAEVRIAINDDPLQGPYKNSITTNNLSTTKETRYRIISQDYEDFTGSILADKDGETIEVNLKPKAPAQQNKLKIFVSNELADVTIDGSRLNGNHDFEQSSLTPGEHLIRVSKPGYKTIEEKIFIDKTEEKSKTFELKPAVATLVIKTEPYNAKFELKNMTTGDLITGETSPSGKRLDKLPVDHQYMIVIYDGPDKLERPWIPEVLSTPNEEQTKVFALKNDPNAQPLQVADAGTRAPAQEKSGATKSGATKSTSKSNAAPKQETKSQERKPAPAPSAPAAASAAPAVLTVGGKPACEVSIKGKNYGSTPKRIELPAGTYTVKCTNANGTFEKNVEVAGGQSLKVMFNK